VQKEATTWHSLLPAVDRVEQRLEKKPQQMVADSGYTTRENIEKMAGREVDFLGTMRHEDVPRGANLPNRFPPSAFLYHRRGTAVFVRRAKSCFHRTTQGRSRDDLTFTKPGLRIAEAALANRKWCAPSNKKNGRSGERNWKKPVVVGVSQEDGSEAVQERYRRRGRVVEFCHVDQEQAGTAAVHVRGLKKVQMECCAALPDYNLQFFGSA